MVKVRKVVIDHPWPQNIRRRKRNRVGKGEERQIRNNGGEGIQVHWWCKGLRTK